MIDLVLNKRLRSAAARTYGRAFFARVIAAAEPRLKIPRGCRAEVGITLVSAQAMRTLNRERRGVDAPTDVLSFPLHMKPISGYTALLLGDLFVCPDIVRIRAAESGRSVRRQMEWSVVHGLLHLVGYDHERSTRAAKAMFSLEQRILDTLYTK
ncbi:MAG: rRNA maturation RNase YbeY [Candidatus Yanofskybacteria bacterium]|nr:rRNA maturation RNase YbeY [Candidatus Yanofskybacteria bacterium]